MTNLNVRTRLLEARNEQLETEIDRLKLALKYQDDREGHIGTHSPECYKFGFKHYECALREIEALTTRIYKQGRNYLELQAQVEKMRDALTEAMYCNSTQTAIDKANAADTMTPKQCLAEHDKEVEINVLDELYDRAGEHGEYFETLEEMLKERRK